MGPVASNQAMTVTLTLAPSAARTAALTRFLADLNTGSSTNFHKWLTPQQFAASYGATPDQIASVSAWAQAQSLKVASVSPSSTRIVLSGSAAQMQAAFSVSIDAFQQTNYSFFSSTGQPSLPADTASLISSIDGLSNQPADLKMAAAGPASTPATLVNGKPALHDVPTLAALIDANATPILSLDATFGSATLTPAQLSAYVLLFRQAAAQGITTIVGRTAVSLGFPAGLAEVTALALPADAPDATLPIAARPAWQFAPGLPADALRRTPDLTTPTLAAFTAAIAQIAGSARLGNINPVLYELAAKPGIYTQPDASATGTWELATGLGLVDLHHLADAFPRGVGQSFTSFQATNYSPIHGQGTSFTSNVTSGTGGPVPTGTVSFVSSTGTVLGTANLVNGTGSITLTTLEGGNLTVDAVYSGDGTYASSTSPTAQLFIQPEPSALSVTIGGTPVIGSSYTVTVTDTASSGVGQPSGPVTVTISGTSSSYTAALQPAGSNSATATVTIPATTAGTLTLSVMCTTSPDFSCYSPYTTTVTIAKATPTLSISYSPNPPVSGASITLNAVVSTIGTAAAPTGSVTFFDNGTTLNASQLNNGATTTTGTVPTTATHSISATYAGDANYNSVSTTAGASTSGTISTSLALTGSASTVTTGQNITFTATLTPSATGPAVPSGSVTFFDNSTQIGTANLINGTTATFATSTLSPTVNHSITAMYLGDGYYSASTSNAVGVGRSTGGNSSTTTLVISATNPVHGQTVTFTATVAGPAGGVAATGTVIFTNTATGAIGQGTLSNGVATFQTNQLPGGTSSYTANYSGDASYNASISPAVSVAVQPEPVTLNISVPATATFGSSFTVLVTVTGASGVAYPTGTVTVTPQGTGYSASFNAGVTSGGNNSTGSASVVVPASGAGSITFTASYTGDKNFAAAGPITTTATVAKAKSATNLSFNPTTPVAGQTTTLIAKVGFAGPIGPTGTVQFFNGSTSLGTAALDSTGTATLATTFASGNQTVTAVYSGDNNYLTSTSAATNTSTGTTTTATTLTITPNPAAPGSVVTFTSSVGPTVNGVAPSGFVQFISAGTVLCTGTLANGSAACSITLSGTAAGTNVVTANYGGDATYAASVSPAVNLVVSMASGGLSSSLSASTAAGGTVVYVTAILTGPAGVVPTGSVSATVTNFAGTANLSTATGTLVPNGTTNTATASIPVTVPAAAATYNVMVSCINTNVTCLNNNLTLVSTGASTTGRIATTTTLTATIPTSTSTTVTLTATVTPAATGTAAASGTVVFYDGTTQIGTATLVAGTASTTATLAAATTHSLTAVYSGDTLYAGSASTAVTTITVGTATLTPTITLTASNTSGLAGSTVVLTATVTGLAASKAVPTGTVSFYSAGSTPRLLGTAALGQTGSASATATLSTTLIAAGSQSVYAVYSGDSNFATVISNFITLGLTDYSLTFVPQSLTLKAGTSGQTTILLGVVNSFGGTVVFGCTPPPNTQITCSFSPTALTGGGSTTMTISTVAPKARGTQSASLGIVGGVSLAGLLCFLLPTGRRRLPTMLAVLLALALTANLGCSNNSFLSGTAAGTPLGSAIVTVTSAGSDGVSTVRHDYSFQVTVQ